MTVADLLGYLGFGAVVLHLFLVASQTKLVRFYGFLAGIASAFLWAGNAYILNNTPLMLLQGVILVLCLRGVEKNA